MPFFLFSLSLEGRVSFKPSVIKGTIQPFQNIFYYFRAVGLMKQIMPAFLVNGTIYLCKLIMQESIEYIGGILTVVAYRVIASGEYQDGQVIPYLFNI
jgi:hypothetical protein